MLQALRSHAESDKCTVMKAPCGMRAPSGLEIRDSVGEGGSSSLSMTDLSMTDELLRSTGELGSDIGPEGRIQS